MTYTFPLPWLAVIALVGYGGVLARMTSTEAARRHAIGVTVAVFMALAAVLGPGNGHATLTPVIFAAPLGPWAAPFTLTVDTLGTVFTLTTAGLTVALVLGLPARWAAPADLRDLLWLEATLLLAFTASDAKLFAVAWTLSLLASAHGERGWGRENHVTSFPWRASLTALGLIVVPLVAGVGLAASPPSEELGPGVFLRERPLRDSALWLLVAAGVFRLGLFPASGWNVTRLERGRPGVALLGIASQPGAYLVARVAGHLSADSDGPALLALVGMGALTALLGALLANAERSWRRLLAALSVAEAGLVTLGFGSFHGAGFRGATVLMTAFALSWAGLALVALALEARTDTRDFVDTRGAARGLPRLATIAFLFGCLFMGYPGGVTFVAEDLLIFGAFERNFGLGIVVIGTMALAGLAIMRALMASFLGEPRGAGDAIPPTGRDLLPREQAAFLLLVLAGLGFGLAPRWVVDRAHVQPATGDEGSTASHETR